MIEDERKMGEEKENNEKTRDHVNLDEKVNRQKKQGGKTLFATAANIKNKEVSPRIQRTPSAAPRTGNK